MDPETSPEASPPTLPDGGTESDGRATGHAGRSPAVPDWVPTDDVLADHADRQVLVVGDTVAGLALTLLLRRAGYDPLVVGGTSRPLPSRSTYLCPPVVRTLDAIGVGAAIRERGTRINRVSIYRPDSPAADSDRSSVTSAERTPPLVVNTECLWRTLTARLPDEKHDADRSVEALSRGDDGLTVRFEDGVRERFDIVVDAGGGGTALRGPRGSPAADTLRQYERLTESDALARQRLREYWCSDFFAQRIPSPNGSSSLLRVTTPQSDIDEVLEAADFDTLLPDVSADLDSGLAEAEVKPIRQLCLSGEEAVPEWWGTGRVCFCGPAACPVAPASGYDITFGIEDAVAFVSTLTEATRAVDEVVERFASRRVRRLTGLQKASETTRADSGHPMNRPTRSAVGTLRELRSVAFGSFLGASLRSLQLAGFDAK